MCDKTVVSNGIEVNLAMRNPCNYSCYYCVADDARVKVSRYSLHRLHAIYQSLRDIGGGIGSFIVTSLECGNGEPTLHPQIRDVLEISTQYGMVSIPTNNSISPLKWMPRIHPEKLLVRSALHPEGETKLESFLERLLYIRNAGANVYVVFIAHPERFDKIEAYYNYFLANRINMEIVAFIGEHRGKSYPSSYTAEELAMLHLTEDSWWYHRLVPEMKIRNFSGIPCIAGYRSFFIGPDGELRRCLYDQTILNSPYGEAIPCKVKNCGCGLLLKELNTLDCRFWNFWRGLAGLELLQEDTSDSEELYKEKRAIYWHLMERYGKITRFKMKEGINKAKIFLAKKVLRVH